MAGEGSLFRRKSDRLWVAQISAGPRGQRKIVRRYRRTRALAQLALEELRATAGRADEKTTVGTYLRAWLEGPGRSVLKASSWETYELSVRLHIEPNIGTIGLARLTPEDVEIMAARLRRKLSGKGVRNVLAILGRVLAVAERRRQITRNPVRYVEHMRVSKPPPAAAMTPAEGRRVLAAVAGDRLEALYVLTLAAGLRQAEVLGLRWSDVDLEAATVQIAVSLDRVDGKYVLTDTKTKVVATLALPTFAVEALHAHRARQLEERLSAGVPTEEGLVFVSQRGRPINGGWLSHRWRRLAGAAGIDRRFHDLRHGHTDILVERRVHPKVIQARDRHKTIAQTMDRYAHTTSEQDRQAAAEIQEAIG